MKEYNEPVQKSGGINTEDLADLQDKILSDFSKNADLLEDINLNIETMDLGSLELPEFIDIKSGDPFLDVNVDVQSEVKSKVKSEVKPEVKPKVQSEMKFESKPAAKPLSAAPNKDKLEMSATQAIEFDALDFDENEENEENEDIEENEDVEEFENIEDDEDITYIEDDEVSRARKPKKRHTGNRNNNRDKSQSRNYNASDKKASDKKASNKNRKDKKDKLIQILMIAGGAAAVIMIVVVALVFTRGKDQYAAAEVSAISSGISDVAIIGESGLDAVLSAQTVEVTPIDEYEYVDEEPEAETEEEIVIPPNINATVNVTSIDRDLKIKFVNADTQKLITGIEFEAEIISPEKKTAKSKDTDKDGIIHFKDLKGAEYSVVFTPIDGVTLPESMKASVKGQIEYKAVAVADEIKKESEINAAKEDTGKVDAVIESRLPDTVAWVESSAKPIGNKDGFQSIAKTDIVDPASTVKGAFMIEPIAQRVLSALDITTVSIEKGKSQKISYTAAEGNTVEFTSGTPEIATVDGSGNITGIKAGTAMITVTEKDAEPKIVNTATCAVTVTEPVPETPIKQLEIAFTSPPTSLAVGQKVTLTYDISKNPANTVTITSSDPAVISVSGAELTALKDGTATITAVVKAADANEKDGTATITINVVAAPTITIALKADKATIKKIGDTFQIEATVSSNINNPSTNKVTYASDKTNIATVDEKGLIKAAANGTAVITVTTKESAGNTEYKAEAKFTVTVNDVTKDTVTQLKDKNGNLLYVKKGTDYVIATYADYYTATEFFKKSTAYMYYGWQTLNGKVYYYDQNGNPVKGDQVIGGIKYHFTNDGVLSMGSSTLGIDISKWQTSVDFNAVKAAGVSYVIIRCGYRGSSTGALIEDPKFRSHINGAKAAGLKIGVYFFTQAVNEVEAVEEASMAINLVRGYSLAYPIFIDTESSGGRGDLLNAAQRTAAVNAFCRTVQNAGYTAGVYASKNWYETRLDASSLSAYKIWLAQYATAVTYKGRYDLWQFSSTGKLPGISGNVDMNYSYLGY